MISALLFFILKSTHMVKWVINILTSDFVYFYPVKPDKYSSGWLFVCK